MHHDDVLGRLTDGAGRLDRMTAAALQRVPFRDSAERMLTLGELCDLVAGRAAMLLELKSRFDGDSRSPPAWRPSSPDITARSPRCRSIPMQLNVLRHKSPRLPRGIVAAKYRPHPYWDRMPPWLRYGHGFAAAVLDGPAAFRRLCGRRPAGLGAARCAAHFVPAAADLGGADSARATARGPLRRPDDLRGLPAMKPFAERAAALKPSANRSRLGMSPSRQSPRSAKSTARRGMRAPIRRWLSTCAAPATRRRRKRHRQLPYGRRCSSSRGSGSGI